MTASSESLRMYVLDIHIQTSICDTPGVTEDRYDGEIKVLQRNFLRAADPSLFSRFEMPSRVH